MPIRIYIAALSGIALLIWGLWLWISLGLPLSWRSITDATLLSRNVIDKDSPIFAISLGVLCLAYAFVETLLRRKQS